ncbi:uncharacterized protein zgc:113229 [Platichthys flesus]|uniref:uncharacterized protein zgc:113229 n=1 Tax=Platichthys flesus TaxID=8260 RepID=UPI002DB55BEC|nr:uncharacterized protein zgc:113229 [Platichthys flesus]
MSHSHTPTDTQGMLQSMLQRLRLQPGREGQPLLHSPGSITAASNRPFNGFEYGTNGISAGDELVLKSGEIRQASAGCGMDRGLVSFPSQNNIVDKDTGENRVLGEATSPRVTPAGTGQLFPAKSLKGADITSFEETDREKGTFCSSAMTGQVPALTNSGQNAIQDLVKVQGFAPKVYMWSLTPTAANIDTGSQESKVLHVGNGEFGASAQSKDIQFVASGQTTKNSSSRRKQRSTESKPRRWTQKIKERWMDRQGSSVKREKEDGGRVDQNSQQGTEISPQKQPLPAEHLIITSHKEEEGTLVSLDASEAPPPHTDDRCLEERFRPSSDSAFGLGSFSLLEEIVTGQEWARFLKPNLPAASANQRPSGEPPSQLKHPPDFIMAQISPDRYYQPVNMDVSEGKQQQHVLVADQPEPMEEWLPGERGRGQQPRPQSFVERADILDNPLLKRIQLNRKRQHHSAARDARLATYETASASSPRVTSSHVMDESAESQHDVHMPLNPLKSPPAPLPPFKPVAPAPRGVLKHSMFLDSEPSMEIVTKRRRVEENRRVRFSEEVLTIDPPELDLDAEDSEDDSGAEDDSVIEQEFEVEQLETEKAEAATAAAAVAAVAAVAARRSVLPAWIQALKRRNTGRKHR